MAVIENKSSKFKKCALALAVAAGMSLAGASAHAAGLGKLTVLSGLGQPLRAEVTLSATPEELSGMTARLAPADVFSQAGVEYSSVLNDLSFNVEKRKGGKAVLKISSGRPVNDPFLDFLVELNWPTGRLVREYTFLLDPPEFSPAAKARSTVDARVVETVRDNRHDAPVASAPAAKPVDTAASAKAAPVASAAKAPAATAEPGQHTVERGENLRKIAAERQYAGVTLEQMLAGIYRNNRKAFIENDIHRLKAGAILNIPDEAAVAAISPKEARQIYVSAGDFDAYRKKLAAAASQGAESKQDAVAPEQAAAGKITPRVEEKTPAIDASKDQVKVGRADKGGKGDKANDLERLALEKSLQESQTRVTLLEKNLGELQKLLEMKNQRLAELEKPAVAPPAAAVVAPVAATPAEVVKEAVSAPAQESAPAAETASAAETPAEQAAAPAEETAPAPVAEPAPVPVEKPIASVSEPEPVPEAGFLDGLLEDPLPLVGGAGALALLGGLFFYRRRQQNTATEIALTETLPPPPSSLGPNSVFGTNGGQTVDTGTAPPHTGEFSQAGPGTIDTDEVDPVAEADVYMAYGRDSQAEEILLEAMHKDPSRLAIHAKLLEIYANRRSTKQFETLAGELYAQSGGNGPEWHKVAEMGRQIDPSNPLYGAAKTSAAVSPGAPVEIALPPEAPVATVEPVAVSAFEVPASESDSVAVEAATVPELPQDSPEQAADADLSFDFPAAEPEAPVVPTMATTPAKDTVLEFAAEKTQPLSFAAPEVSVPEEGAEDPFVASDISLDFDLGDSKLAAAESPAPSTDVPAAAVTKAPVATDGMHQFSPEGTLVVAPRSDFTVDETENDLNLDGLDFAQPGIAAPASTELVAERDALPETLVATQVPTDMSTFAGDDAVAEQNLADLAQSIETAPSFASTVVNMPDLTSTVINTSVGAAEDIDFDVKLSDSVFLGQPMASDFDIGSINLDLAAEPAPAATTPETEATSPVRDGRWEEVNTKLDLAKAYQEMGDLEGARELLQEVIGEGPVDLVEKAREVLAQIGG